MDFDTEVKLAIYRHFAETSLRPTTEEVAARIGAPVDRVLEAYPRLRAQRVLALEADGTSIRMAPPFSGVRTQHVSEIDGKRYFANCAWDALGIPAAFHHPATVHSSCGESGEPLRLEIALDGPEPSSWLFHCLVPAAKWWDDIVFT
jgi:Alkylmercury lyase